MVQADNRGEAAASLSGRRVVVVTPGTALGRPLAIGLKRHGARIVEVDVAFESLAAAKACLSEAVDERGGIDLVVHACASPVAVKSRALDTLSADEWDGAVHSSMLASLFCLQASHACMRDNGGSVVLVGPAESLVGAPALVPLMTLVEGQRSLVKSAARQWGRLGIRLNWVGVAARHYAPQLADANLALSPELGAPPPALGRAGEPQAEVADTIAWLASEGGRGMTGACLNLDGGDWMVP